MSWENLDQTWHYVEKWAQARPDAEAVVFGEKRLTWKDFQAEMDRTAKAFLDAGVEKGDRIAMLSMAMDEFLTTYMAAGKIGAMWLGVSPKFTLDEILYLLNDCRPTVLVTLRTFQDADLEPLLTSIRESCPFIRKILVIGEPPQGMENFEAFIARPRPELDEALAKRSATVNPDDDALLIYTSGSTGKPKGVVHTHRSIVENIRAEVEKFFFDENTRGLLHFPINHVAADVEIGFGAIMAGGCLVLMDKFDPSAVLATIPKEKITCLGQIPAMFLMEFKDPAFGSTDLSSIKHYIWAGSAAPRIMLQVLQAICQKTGARMITGYGSTETCGFVTYTEPDDPEDVLLKSAGKIAPPFELKIVDRRRQELPDGQVGEIAVRGPFLMKGYFNNPQATADVVDEDGWYYTSDLASRDENGYIYIAGRTSEMYKTGGENVYPREIEDVIETHPGVLFAAVVPAPDDVYQEVGWAFVMTMPGQNVDDAELREICRGSLANFKVPKKFVVRPLLPLLPTGKVNKLALRQEVAEIMKGQ